MEDGWCFLPYSISLFVWTCGHGADTPACDILRGDSLMPYIPYYWDNRVYAIMAVAWLLFAIVAANRVAKGKRSRIAVGSLVGFFLTFVGYGFYILDRQLKEKTDEANCFQNLRMLGEGVVSCLKASGKKFPQADHWDTTIAHYLKPEDTERVFHCPAAHSRYSYAYNTALSNISLWDIADPGNTVVLFECDTDSRSATGGQRQFNADRHLGGSNCLMVDGTQKRVNTRTMNIVFWKPSGGSGTPDTSPPSPRPNRSKAPAPKKP